MELTKKDLISILKNRISSVIDLRSDNIYARYYDYSGQVEWSNSLFNKMTTHDLEYEITVFERLSKKKTNE